MKKHLLYVFLILMIADISMAFGQPTRNKYRKSQPAFGYGAKAGVNIASQSTTGSDVAIDVKGVVRINAGGYCNYYVNEYLGIQAELLASGKGAHWKDFYDDMKDLLTYVDIPLLIKYQPVSFINIQAGVQAGLRVTAKQKDLKTGIKSDIKDYYNFTDYSLTGGVEANLPNKINLTLRYVYGLTPATNDVQYVDPWKNNLIQFSVGYRFSGR